MTLSELYTVHIAHGLMCYELDELHAASNIHKAELVSLRVVYLTLF